MKQYVNLFCGALCLSFLLVACQGTTPPKDPVDPIQPHNSYPDSEVFVSLIPYPCNEWGASKEDIEAWEYAHGGTLNQKKSEEYSTSQDLFLWYDVDSKANPVRGYYVNRARGAMDQAIGYYAPCSLVVSDDGTKVNPVVDNLLTQNGYEYTGLAAEGFFQYTSPKVGKVLRIARVELDGEQLAYVTYHRKP